MSLGLELIPDTHGCIWCLMTCRQFTDQSGAMAGNPAAAIGLHCGAFCLVPPSFARIKPNNKNSPKAQMSAPKNPSEQRAHFQSKQTLHLFLRTCRPDRFVTPPAVVSTNALE